MKTFFMLIGLIIGVASFASEQEYDHVFFDNALMAGPYFYSKADYTGASYVKHEQHKLPVSFDHCFTAKNSLQLDYISAGKGTWSAVVRYPDWRGKDFIRFGQYLDFRMYISSPTNAKDLPKIAIGKYNQSDTIMSDFVPLENYVKNITVNEWIHVHIPLNVFKLAYTHSKEIKQITFRQGSDDGKEHCLYIDQIELVPENMPLMQIHTPAVSSVKAYERHVDVQWQTEKLQGIKYIEIDRSEDGTNFHPVGIQDPQRGRYADYTGETGKTYFYKIAALDYDYRKALSSSIHKAGTHPMSDEQLLDMVQEASFRYYWEGSEPQSGLALENIPGRKIMIAAGASGFGMMAILAGTERGFITRQQAVERFIKIMDYLKKADRFHGVYAHFMDGESGKAVPFFGNRDNGGDLVETAFLFQGLLSARQYFDQNTQKEKLIRDGITQLWNEVEWDWYKKTKDSNYLYWHWSPDQEWVISHKLIGWNETMITYLLAIASPTHGVDKNMYYTGWASQEKEAQDYRSSWGQTLDGKMYSNGNTYFGAKLDVGVSSGGPLFFIHYSFMGFDPHGIKDKFTEKDYFNTFWNMALINYRYCIENLKNQRGYASDCWGLTASDGPWRYHAAEPVLHQDDGTMAPTGALASFPYTPEQSMAALKNYYRNYGSFLWGEYGFRDAFNLNENWCANIYMGLNQAPVTVMIENYRSGKIWNLFMNDPEIRKMASELFEKNK